MSDRAAEMNTRDARARFADVIHDASVRGKITYVMHRGRRVAAVVPVAIAEAAEVARPGRTAPVELED